MLSVSAGSAGQPETARFVHADTVGVVALIDASVLHRDSFAKYAALLLRISFSIFGRSNSGPQPRHFRPLRRYHLTVRHWLRGCCGLLALAACLFDDAVLAGHGRRPLAVFA